MFVLEPAGEVAGQELVEISNCHAARLAKQAPAFVQRQVTITDQSIKLPRVLKLLVTRPLNALQQLVEFAASRRSYSINGSAGGASRSF